MTRAEGLIVTVDFTRTELAEIYCALEHYNKTTKPEFLMLSETISLQEAIKQELERIGWANYPIVVVNQNLY